MGSPLATTPNFIFLCLLVTENGVPNCLLCRHICPLIECLLHAPLRIHKCLSDWNQASQAVIQGNKPVLSLSDLGLLPAPHQRIDLTGQGLPIPLTHHDSDLSPALVPSLLPTLPEGLISRLYLLLEHLSLTPQKFLPLFYLIQHSFM